MKITAREKVLLVVLIIMVIGLCYYSFFLKPYQEKMAFVENEIEETDNLITLQQAKVAKKNKMLTELEAIENSDSFIEISKYDNLPGVMREVTSILSSADDYKMQFGKLSTDSLGIVRRPITMVFNVGSYADARGTIDEIAAMDFRKQITGVEISNAVVSSSKGRKTVYTVNLAVTFYEFIED